MPPLNLVSKTPRIESEGVIEEPTVGERPDIGDAP
jgi:hypothetical protein